MLISEQWLRQWANPALERDALVAQLSMAGLEVDSVTPAAAAFSGVVVGKVVSLEQHPDADRLRVAQVDVGQAQLLQIVCGAPNVAVGMHAPTAVIGALLPGDFKIKKSKLRGIESQGMLCSAKELGLSEDASGLWALPADSVPGTDLRAWLELDDQVIEVDLTPNRGDCLSVQGVAREVALLNHCPLQRPAIEPVVPQIDDQFPVTLQAPEHCPRYIGRIVRGVNAQAVTPMWLQERLRRAGVRSLGPLVDVTNYVMLELGQPMHAFDLAQLSGGIVVRLGQAGETLELLNGNTITLDGETLVIADQQRPLALAGIMGGEGSGCSDSTQDVLLESAFFTPQLIAGKARRYGLHTDSSHRFERGVDFALQQQAMERATALLLQIAGGQPGPIVEALAAEQLPQLSPITLRPSRLSAVLGFAIAQPEVSAILAGLEAQVQWDGQAWQVLPPSWRFDLRLEVDLIEEVARVYGYERLPEVRPRTPLSVRGQREQELPLSRLREVLVQRGYQEAITYSFVDPRFQQALDPELPAVALANPISADLSVMRTSLWPGLVKALAYNQARQQARVRLFESGLTFRQIDGQLQQRPFIGGVLCGQQFPEQWGAAKRGVDFYDLKGDVQALLALSGEGEYRYRAERHPALHPGQSARVLRNDQPVGWLGALHPQLESSLELDGPVLVFELDLTAISCASAPKVGELSRYPASRRDLALLVDEQVSAQALLDCIYQQGGELLREAWLFDVYRGKGIPEGHKSMAFGLILQDFSNNLTDQAVEATLAGIIAGLSTLGATLRV